MDIDPADHGAPHGPIGLPLSSTECQVRDENGQALPPGETGELCVSPATTGEWAGVYTPMLGYWNQPEASREALRGGRYHTGDLGTLDEDGNVYVRGRRSELILRGGANVYPAEVERVLLEHPDVAAAAVLGIPDERLGERVVAAVEPRPGTVLEPGDLLTHAQDSLARYKVPDRILVLESLPRNAMQKIVKRELLPRFRPEA